jgi:environmental stress-induced protein Ves
MIFAAPRHLNELESIPWSNGGGSTTEVATDAKPWNWRLSVADIGVEGPFSNFQGVRREFTVLDALVMLAFEEREVEVRRLEVVRFDGGTPPYCRLPEKTTRAVNLMLRGDTEGMLVARPLAGSMMLPGGFGWIVLCITGHATVQQGTDIFSLEAGMFMQLASEGGRALLEGAGEVVLARL